MRSGCSYFEDTALASSVNTYYTFVPVFAEVCMYLRFFYLAQAFIFYSGIELFKSDLFPTKNITDDSAFALQSSYQLLMMLSKLSGLREGNNILADIENEQGPMASFEISGDYGSVLFLTCGVPNI